MRFNWTFDVRRQELRSPAGMVIHVREIAQVLADRRNCRHDFHGEWSGWKMRRQFLIPPFSGRNGPKLTPTNAKLFVAWVAEPTRLEAIQRMTSEKPRLYLVSNRTAR